MKNYLSLPHPEKLSLVRSIRGRREDFFKERAKKRKDA